MTPSKNKKRGRPPAYEIDDALDAAMRIFWRDGYARTDLDEIAKDVNATKPSLYRSFGNKEQLFLLSLERYAKTVGREPIDAFEAEPNLHDAVRAFLRTIIRNAAGAATPPGCMMASVASEATETIDGVRDFCARVTHQTENRLTERFAAAADANRLPEWPRAQTRAKALMAAMNSLSLRGRYGEDEACLLGELDETAKHILCGHACPTPPIRS